MWNDRNLTYEGQYGECEQALPQNVQETASALIIINVWRRTEVHCDWSSTWYTGLIPVDPENTKILAMATAAVLALKKTLEVFHQRTTLKRENY